MQKFLLSCTALLAMLMPQLAFAGGGSHDFTTTGWGILAVVIFSIAYILVIFEEQLHLRKSKPVVVAAGFIWIIVAIVYAGADLPAKEAENALHHAIMEFAELFLFLLAAMTFINTMTTFNVFENIRCRIVNAGFSLRGVFWMTGLIAFFLSPIADNLTTALVMGTVVLAVARDNPKFVCIAAINIVVAANAGGAFSPFGDITTLMVWQAGHATFTEFFRLFVPSVVNWIIPAVIMSFAVSNEKSDVKVENVEIIKGGHTVVVLFLGTIALAVSMHNFLHLPPVLGMMTGLGVLKMYAWSIRRTLQEHGPFSHNEGYDVFKEVERAEWDTLLFFYGVILAVAGLSALGYLAHLSTFMYDGLGTTTANVLVGILSAIVDNIPVMFAVLTMEPTMPHNQWLLVTLTAGVGGSLLSVGSAAGVAMMGQARGYYTFFGHLRWTWAIALGYAGSIYTHILINGLN